MAHQEGLIDPELVDRIAAEIEALNVEPTPPPGSVDQLRSPAGAGDRDGFKRALPHILKGLIEAGLIATTGPVSADTVRVIAGAVFTLFRILKKAPAPE